MLKLILFLFCPLSLSLSLWSTCFGFLFALSFPVYRIYLQIKCVGFIECKSLYPLKSQTIGCDWVLFLSTALNIETAEHRNMYGNR